MNPLEVFSIFKCCLTKKTLLQMTKCPGERGERKVVNHIFVTFLKR